MQEILNLMRELGWAEDLNYGMERSFTSHDREYSVSVIGFIGHLGFWSLGRFTDSDIDGVATGRYEHMDDGATVEELKAALRDVPLESLLHLADQGLTETFTLLAKAGWTSQQVRQNMEVLKTVKGRM